MENWKDINGYEGRYAVSDLGNVKTIAHYIPHNMFPNVQKFVRERVRKLQKHNHGYLSVVLGKNDMQLVHRLVAEAFCEKSNGKDFVNHKNGNKQDNRPENLEWCTRQENEDHAYGTGLKNSTGSANEMAKLTEEQVGLIKREYVPRRNSTELAKRFNVSRATINRIGQGKIWKHVA